MSASEDHRVLSGLTLRFSGDSVLSSPKMDACFVGWVGRGGKVYSGIKVISPLNKVKSILVKYPNEPPTLNPKP